jgi:hypothetical protein
VATSTLKDELVAVGLPASPPAGADAPVVAAVGAGAAALLACAMLLVATRRPQKHRHVTT